MYVPVTIFAIQHRYSIYSRHLEEKLTNQSTYMYLLEKHNINTKINATLQTFFFLEVEPKGQTDKLSTDQVKDILCHDDLTKITSPRLPKECTGCLSLWLQENEMEKMELEEGEMIRVKTSGNGPFICKYYLSDVGVKAQNLAIVV